MTFNITQQGDQPFAPGNYGYAFIPDQLIAGSLQLVTKNVQIMSGILPRGTVIGRQTTFTLIPTPGTNTGNGTIGATSMQPLIERGLYTLVALTPTTFSVTDPEQQPLGTATVGQAFTSNQVNFTITAGSTAFVAGDSFTLNSLGTAGNFVVCVKTATDGSQVPIALTADYIDASAGPARTGAYFMGEFNWRAVTYDSSWNLMDLAAALEPRGVFLKDSISAADPINSAANSTY